MGICTRRNGEKVFNWNEKSKSRFWEKVDQSTSGCHLWKASKFKKGYGQFRATKTKTLRAHRCAYELIHGPIPDGMMVLHKCNNRACCNPEHLYLGDNSENMVDRNQSGTFANQWTGPIGKRPENAI